ncbi:MAG TPA: hypothetical protein DHW02_03730 [Ktedonobacter sp.]|nr:hypothetical protein [Ktedonobacter sp.]
MPRPSKHVSPDTLGGRIRSAREHQHLSLADVASGHYSTSLISQIERNRVDPSQESLRFLADRLQLSLNDLEVLAQQHRETEVEARQFVSYDSLRNDAAQLLAEGKVSEALNLLERLHFAQVPSLQRWRLATLRGLCYFEKRQFVKAQEDLIYAIQEKPELDSLSPEQRQEMVLLHLRLAGTHRALNQLNNALMQFEKTLSLVNRDTPFGYVAEAQWEISLIEVAQASVLTQEPLDEEEAQQKRNEKLHNALKHANNALHLYNSIGEHLQEAALSCHIARIEKELGYTQEVQQRLQELLCNWTEKMQATCPDNTSLRRAQANIVSSAAYMLAEVALENGDLTQARQFAERAMEAAEQSYIVRRAEAHTMLGRILEAQQDRGAEQEFRAATTVLAETQRIGARISAHLRLGSYLFSINESTRGQQEIDEARRLSESVLTGGDVTPKEDIPV